MVKKRSDLTTGIALSCNDIIGSAKGSQISEKY
jgi:hypothetical protein